jgi:hypothetical protein
MQLYSIKYWSQQSGIPQQTLYAAAESGLLPCYRIKSRPNTRGSIRISEEQWSRYLQAMESKPPAPQPKPLRHIHR